MIPDMKSKNQDDKDMSNDGRERETAIMKGQQPAQGVYWSCQRRPVDTKRFARELQSAKSIVTFVPLPSKIADISPGSTALLKKTRLKAKAEKQRKTNY